MDRVMAFLHKYIGGFFQWWKELTGLETKYYFDGKLRVVWHIVAFVVLLWVLMLVFLPWYG